MPSYVAATLALLSLYSTTTTTTTNAFVPSSSSSSRTFQQQQQQQLSATAAPEEAVTYPQVDERTGKSTGISFLPDDVIATLSKGSPVEKVKLAKDGTSAFVDVYEYARKIREGEMTWEEVETAELDSVCCV